jgi:hypothetical protein
MIQLALAILILGMLFILISLPMILNTLLQITKLKLGKEERNE